jgi:hypothetical protein
LVENGVDVNNTPTRRWRWLDRDRILSSLDFVLKAGADAGAPVCCHPSRITLLQRAIRRHKERYNQLALIQLLLISGAFVNKTIGHSHGSSVMEAAAGRGDLEVMRLLLNSTATFDDGERRYNQLQSIRTWRWSDFFWMLAHKWMHQ